MSVMDVKGNEIKVGSTVLFGGDDERAEVVRISDPDVVYNPVTDGDDGGYAVWITVKFADGETEELRAMATYHYGDDDEPYFEEGGDIIVVTEAA